MIKEILIGWFTFILALAIAIGIIFVAGVFVLWVDDKVDTAWTRYRCNRYRRKMQRGE